MYISLPSLSTSRCAAAAESSQRKHCPMNGMMLACPVHCMRLSPGVDHVLAPAGAVGGLLGGTVELPGWARQMGALVAMDAPGWMHGSVPGCQPVAMCQGCTCVPDWCLGHDVRGGLAS